MAKKKSSLVSFVKNVARRKAAKKANPAGYSLSLPDMGLLGDVGAGGVAFATTVVPARLAHSAMEKRWSDSTWVRHMPPLLGGTVFMLLWLLTSKTKSLKRYQLPILIGSGIAVLNLALRTWFPRLSWILGGADPAMMGPGSMGAPPYSAPRRKVADIAYLPSAQADDERDLSGDDDDELLPDDEEELYTGTFAKK